MIIRFIISETEFLIFFFSVVTQVFLHLLLSVCHLLFSPAVHAVLYNTSQILTYRNGPVLFFSNFFWLSLSEVLVAVLMSCRLSVGRRLGLIG